MVINHDGTVSVNATVHLLNSGFSTDTATAPVPGSQAQYIIDSTRTDNNGIFSFDSILPGKYIIEAFDDSTNAVRYSGLIIDAGNTKLYLGILALKPVGSLKGRVSLSLGGNPRKVMVVASGGDRISIPDESGIFTFNNLPEGDYSLRLIPSLDNYDVLDTGSFHVVSDSTADIGTLYPPYTGIPSPRNLTLTYEPARQYVFILWESVDTSDIGGYNVHRAPAGGNFECITSQFIPRTVTSYIDTNPGQDTLYQYRVTSLDTSRQFSSIWAGGSSDTIRITSTVTLLRVFSLEQFGKLVAATIFPDGSFSVAQNGFFPRIYRYNSSGTLLSSWMPGEPAQMQEMYLTSDESGLTYIVNYMNDKWVAVYACDSAGTKKRHWVTGMTYDNINGIAVKSNRLYINTHLREEIHVFDLSDTNMIPERLFINKPVSVRSSRGICIPQTGFPIYTMRESILFSIDTTLFVEEPAVISQWTARDSGCLAVLTNGQIVITSRKSMEASVYTPDGLFTRRFSLKQNCAEISAIASGPENTLWVLSKNAQTLLWELRVYSAGM
jgi:hypothetical protein